MPKVIGPILSILIAETAPSVNKIMELHVPPIVMECFQLLAWLSAFIIAVVAVFRYIKERKKKEDENI